VIRSYDVPNPVIRQIVTDIQPTVSSDPASAHRLCIKLWEEPILEFRILAASILGLIPLNLNKDILHTIEVWSKDCKENLIISALTDQSLSRFREESPDDLGKIVEQWLTSTDLSQQRIGLRAVIPLLTSQNFENIPVFYKLLTPYIRIAPPQLRPDILDAIQALARLSPQETAFFLSINLEAPDNPSTAWIIRQSIDHFPEEAQNFLRSALRSIKERSVE
jgi:hypothetical protein